MIVLDVHRLAHKAAKSTGETYVVTEGPQRFMVLPLRIHDATTDGPIIYTAEPPDGETEG